jgi:hypothetical protein
MNMEGEKIRENILKLSHSVIISGLSIIYLYTPNKIIKNLIYFISSPYFSYDTKLILSRKTIDYPMIYHHIVALLLLLGFWIDYYGDVLIYLYSLAEISNIPIYTTYHLIKTSPNMNIIVCSNVIQTIVYGYLRIYCFTDFIIKNSHLIYTPLTPLLGIYLIGWVWFITLCKQVYEDRVTIRYIIYDNLIRNLI